MRYLTTSEAQTIYHIPAAAFAAWCREDKLSATKVGGEWQMAIADIDAFLNANPALRPASTQRENRTWIIFGAIATVLGFVVDAVALYDIIQGGDRTLLWILAGLLSLALWGVALLVLRPRLHKGRPLRFTEQPCFSSRPLLMAARIAVVGMPLMLVLGIVGYNVWRVIPPRQTVVLVADFRDPTGVDSARVTQSMVDGMRETLRVHSNIQVRRLNQFIPAEGGSQQAQAIGGRHKAAIVIWGDYTLHPDPELHVNFGFAQPGSELLSCGLIEDYGPDQILQPTMFDFKLELGTYLGELIAFSSAMALFETGQYKQASPLFDTAAHVIGQRLATRWERVVRLYRATNLLSLDMARDAKSDLEAIAPSPYGAVDTLDEIAAMILSNLGLALQRTDDYAGARVYLERALAYHKQVGNARGEAQNLNVLGLIARNQYDYATAKSYHEQAMAIYQRLGDFSGEASQLINLAAVALQRDDTATARPLLERAIALAHQTNDLLNESAALNSLGMVVLAGGDRAAARSSIEKALEISKRIGAARSEAHSLSNLGTISKQEGDYAAAESRFSQSLAIYQQLGSLRGAAAELALLGEITREQGDYMRAKLHYEEALALYRKTGDQEGQAVQLDCLGGVAFGQGDFEAARALVVQALDLNRAIGNRQNEAGNLTNLAMIALRVGDYPAASSYLGQALDMHRTTNNRLAEATTLATFGALPLCQ